MGRNYYKSYRGCFMFRGDRLERLMDEQGMSQGKLSRAIGVSQVTISRLINKPDAQGSKFTHKIAEILGTNSHYLMGESDDPSPMATGEGRLPFRAGGAMQGFSGRGEKRDADLVQVQQFDIGLGMGGGGFLDGEINGKQRTFFRAWLRQFTRTEPEHLLWTTGIGDSMMPTIGDHDVILIDTSDRVPRVADKIWAISLGNMGMVKRLRPTKDGTGMRIMSDNQAVPEEIAYDGEMHVIGRIAAAVRRF